MIDNLAFINIHRVEHWRNGKLLSVQDVKNGLTTIGKNSLLDVYFRNQTQIAAWYLGLVDATGWTAFDATDTMLSHAGWTELTAYDESARPAWGPAAASAGSMANATTVDFTMNATNTVKGIMVSSNATKSGTSGTLWSTAQLGSDLDVVSGDLLKTTYTLNTSG